MRPVGLEPEKGGCSNYLTKDRLRWWDLWPNEVPATAALAGPAGEAADLVLNEFCSPLATIVGSDLGEVSALFPGRKIPWDQPGLPDGRSPNATVGLEFLIRGVLPGSITVLENRSVNLGGEIGVRDETVLFHDEGIVLDRNPFQVSLFVRFAVPQRAVALEFGFWGAPDLTINPDQVELLAFSDEGPVVTSSAVDLNGRTPLRARTVFNLIGVRSANGDIRTVELRFHIPRGPGSQPQLIRRIWYEAFPPAAVTQGTLGMENYPNPPKPGTIGVPPLPKNQKGPNTVYLPYNFNRAVVLMRGFKFLFLDEKPYRVGTIGAGIGAPATFEVERRGSITFAPVGDLSAWVSGIPGVTITGDPPPFRVLIYYTVVAWDSDEVELRPLGGQVQEDVLYAQANQPTPLTISIPELCPNLQPGSDPSQRCGLLYGGLQDFRYCVSPPVYGPYNQEVDKFGLAVGQMGGGSCGVPSSAGSPLGEIAPVPFGFPDLFRAGGNINWSFCTDLGEPYPYLRALRGVVLAGRSVGLNNNVPSSGGIVIFNVGPRARPDDFFFTFDGDAAWPIEGDMGMLSLGFVYSEPNGPLRELGIEVSGLHYDGERFAWQLGGGVLTLPVVSNDDPARFLFGWPTFGTLSRRFLNPDTRLSVQDLVFDNGVVGLVTEVPSQLGMIRNDGNVAINVADVTAGGPDVTDYAFWINYNAGIFSLDQLPSNAPIQLGPGEALLVTGWFVPQADAPSGQPPRTAWIDFRTSSTAAPQVRMMCLGHTAANRASGILLPSGIDFGDLGLVPPGDPPGFVLHNTLVQSSGQTPLVLTYRLEDATLGFQIVGRDGGDMEVFVNGVNAWQLDSGHNMILHLQFSPVRRGPVHTRLVVQTNDTDPNNRQLTTDLHGTGI
jgi:hypothetical protein